MRKLRSFAVAILGLLVSSAILSGQDNLASKSNIPTKASVVPPADASAQAEAITKHPNLGKAGSDFNREFLARFRRYQTEKPAFFEDQHWPLNLADEVAKAGFPSTGRIDRATESATGTAADETSASLDSTLKCDIG